MFFSALQYQKPHRQKPAVNGPATRERESVAMNISSDLVMSVILHDLAPLYYKSSKQCCQPFSKQTIVFLSFVFFFQAVFIHVSKATKVWVSKLAWKKNNPNKHHILFYFWSKLHYCFTFLWAFSMHLYQQFRSNKCNHDIHRRVSTMSDCHYMWHTDIM